jgi:PTH2 family peptidyl-tRNA hydrolase
MHTKQMIIIRKDLKMRRGKEIAQGSHAVLKTFLDMAQKVKNPDGSCDLSLHLTPAMTDWVLGIFTKITLSVDNEADLLEVYNRAKDANIPCSLILDSGLTELKVPTYTAVSIGPEDSAKIDLITRDNPKLSLY